MQVTLWPTCGSSVGRSSSTSPICRGASGGDSEPRTKSASSPEPTLPNVAVEPGLQEPPLVTPTTNGVASATTSALPLSPLHGELEPETLQRRTALLASSRRGRQPE